MESIFTLPYSEYEVINQLQRKLTKSDGNSFYIPTSRQQKGVDFIVHNNKSNKIIRFQVKSSRAYLGNEKDKYKYYLWFNNFLERYARGNADYYILFGLYPDYRIGKNIKSKAPIWKSLILCFSERDMFRFLKRVKTKKEKNPDRFFGFGFNDDSEVFAIRGFDGSVSKFLIDNQLSNLKKKLK